MFQRACDYCEKEPVELLFKNYQEQEAFEQYGILPHVLLRLMVGLFQVRNGKVFHISKLGISIVVCEKCLAGGDERLMVQAVSEKPRVIQEAIRNLDRVIPIDEAGLAERKTELAGLQLQVDSLKNLIDDQTAFLEKSKKARERLAEELKQIQK